MLDSNNRKIEIDSQDIINNLSEIINSEINRLGLTKISIGLSSCANRKTFLADSSEELVLAYIHKYNALPGPEYINSNIDEEGNLTLSYGDLRAILNEYRPIIFNQNNNSYYRRIKNFCNLLMRDDGIESSKIRIFDIAHKDVTDSYIKIMEFACNKIKNIIDENDFSYVYNGMLQHDDKKYIRRVARDEETGNIYPILYKHAITCIAIKACLYPFATILGLMINFIEK